MVTKVPAAPACPRKRCRWRWGCSSPIVRTRGGGSPEAEYLRWRAVVVLGLPRGGVPVALEVARALGAPLDVIVVRKLGVPFQPELGMGAVGEDGVG